VGRRIALLVATSRYADRGLPQLAAPEHDARRLAELLRDPKIGQFNEVTTLIDEPKSAVEELVEDVLATCRSADEVLLYFSCHGLKDERGQLFLATINSKSDRPNSTAVSARFLAERLEDSHAAAKVVLLDCCYSGAFSKGYVPRGGLPSDLAGQVAGRGSFVLAASDSRGAALEQAADVPSPTSLFTEAVLEGLATGKADLDQDGWVTTDDLRKWVRDRLATAGAVQVPTTFSSGVQGDIRIARGGPSEEMIALQEITATLSGSRPASVTGPRPAPRLNVSYGDLPEVDQNHLRIPIGLDERTGDVVFFDSAKDQHFVVLGEREAGKTNLLRVLGRGLQRLDPDRMRAVVIDPRGRLIDDLDIEHVISVNVGSEIESMVRDVRQALEKRKPHADLSKEQVRNRSWWTGPDLLMMIDDYHLMETGFGNPLADFASLIPWSRDIGLHLVVTAEAISRGMFGPMMQGLREFGSPYLVLSGDPSEGSLVGKVRPEPQPPGRGILLRRWAEPQMIQTAWLPSRRADDGESQ
jgi:hypothetical protein